MPLHVSSTCAHRHEVKIVLYNFWYHHTETSEWSKITKITKITKIQFYKYEHILYYKTIVIINSNEYNEKVHSFLTANNFNILIKDPTEKFHNLIHKTMQKLT